MADPRAASHWEQDHLADFQVADLSAQRLDPPDALIATDRWQRRQHAIFAGKGEDVGRVDGGGQHFDPYLTCAGLWQLQLNGGDHLVRLRAALLVFGF